MSNPSKQLQDCKNGSDCAHYKVGKCAFRHLAPKKGLKKVKTVITHTHGKLVMKHATPVLKALAAVARAKVPDGFVRIAGGKDAKASWSDIEDMESLNQQVSFLRTAARAAIGGNHIRIKLFATSTIAGGAGAAIAGFYGVSPSAAAEWTGLITLYDECRVDALKIKHLLGVTTSAAAGVNGGIVPYAIGWDPDYNTTPSGVLDVQESTYSSLHVAAGQVGFGGMPVTPVGLHQLDVKIPHTGSVFNSDMKTLPNFPGSWMSCLDAGDTVGFMRYYATALGGAGVLGWYHNIEMHCEFRIRT